jgi:hypothetical protein
VFVDSDGIPPVFGFLGYLGLEANEEKIGGQGVFSFLKISKTDKGVEKVACDS